MPRGTYESIFWRQKAHYKFVSAHLINYRRADHDRSMRAARWEQNATLSVLRGESGQTAERLKAREQARTDGVMGLAVGVILADFIFAFC